MLYQPSADKEELDRWKEVTLIYNSALKEIGTKLEILNDEFQDVHKYNPIEHIKARMKTSESIVKKLKSRGYESTIENMVEHVNDIAGIRVICSFTSDIYRIAEMLAAQDDLRILATKDYIKAPKASGYKSYHMLVTVPVFLSNRVVEFWASLEHKIYYKFEGNAPEHIQQSLVNCAKIVEQLDAEMLSLNNEVQSFVKE